MTGTLMGLWGLFCLHSNPEISQGASEALHYLFKILVLQRSKPGWSRPWAQLAVMPQDWVLGLHCAPISLHPKPGAGHFSPDPAGPMSALLGVGWLGGWDGECLALPLTCCLGQQV